MQIKRQSIETDSESGWNQVIRMFNVTLYSSYHKHFKEFEKYAQRIKEKYGINE